MSAGGPWIGFSQGYVLGTPVLSCQFESGFCDVFHIQMRQNLAFVMSLWSDSELKMAELYNVCRECAFKSVCTDLDFQWPEAC